MTGSDTAYTERQRLVSQRLRQRRQSLGMTQQQVVVRLADLGVHTTNKAVSTLERGAGLDVGKLPELAAALNCSVTYLLGLVEDPGSWEPDRRIRPQAPVKRNERRQPRILGSDLPGRQGRAW